MDETFKLNISVVIPMYNASNSIIRALDSVKNQTFKCNYQIIVVNDGSKDDSKVVVESYITANPEMDLLLIDQINGGVSKARNTGLKNANGDYIAFLDSDDAWKINKIQEQLNVFHNNPSIDFLGTGFKGFGIHQEIQLKNITFDHLLYRNYFQPSTILMKKEIVAKIGYFDENQRYAEEGNYFFRVAREFQCFFLNKELIYFGDEKCGYGESGLSANLKEMEKGELKNLKFAYQNKWISAFKYYFLVSFSLLKYCRRVLIVKFR